MSIHVEYIDHHPPVNWLTDGAPLPDGLMFDCLQVADGETGSDEVLIEDSYQYQSQLKSQEYSGILRSDILTAIFLVIPARTSTIDISQRDYQHLGSENPESMLLKHTEELLKFFDERDAYYGFGCRYVERFHRNLFKVDLWGDGRFATSQLGQDIRKYIPGLYWMNYFSNSLLKKYPIGIDAIAKDTGGSVQRLRHGVLLGLYDSPADWESRRDVVDGILEQSEYFFSMRRVAEPGHLTPAEMCRYLEKLSKEWP
jgi:hypothetical protein